MPENPERPLVPYRPFNGRHGIALQGTRLIAFLHGEPVAEAQTSPAPDLDKLISTYEAIWLLPDVDFAYRSRRRVELELDLEISLPRRLFGVVIFDGQRMLWRAECGRSSEFLLIDELPDGQRTWARSDEPGSGWEFFLPSPILFDQDPIVPRRTALAIEQFIYSILQGREMTFPHRRAFSNVFSARNPTWTVNLPRIISPAEMRRRKIF